MRLGLVVPWFGEAARGGVERLAMTLGRDLGELGHSVEILTTRGRTSFDPWDDNAYGDHEEVYQWGIVRRFALDERNVDLYNKLFSLLHSGGTLSWLEEQQLLLQKVNSREMYRYISGQDTDYVTIGMPYYYGLVHWALRSAPGPTVFIPCLHSEPEAFMYSTKQLFGHVSHVMLLSHEELKLAQPMVPPCADLNVLGAPVKYEIGLEERFRAAYGIRSPYILYVGRKVPGKGLDVVLKMFMASKGDISKDVKFVIMGQGDLADVVGATPLEDVIDLGEVSERDKFDAMAGAISLCHFSKMESFSITLMESWLQGTPAIVASEAAVLSDHVRRSSGGWIVDSTSDFAQAINEVFSDEQKAVSKGRAGKIYAQQFTGLRIAEKLVGIIGK